MSSPSFEELDWTRQNSNEFFPSEEELKTYEFQPLKNWTDGMMRKNGESPEYCPKTRTYRYSNIFQDKEGQVHYFKALAVGKSPNQDSKSRRFLAAKINGKLSDLRLNIKAHPELLLSDLYPEDVAFVELLRKNL